MPNKRRRRGGGGGGGGGEEECTAAVRGNSREGSRLTNVMKASLIK